MPKRKRVQQVANSGEKHHSRVEAHNLFPDTPKAKKISKTSSTPRGHRSSQNLPLVPFMNDDTILLVGEASVVEEYLEHAENVTATSFDNEAILHSKYKDVKENIQTVLDCCGSVRYGIDARQLDKYFANSRFDSIIFNFPHTGSGIKDQDRNILANQKMLLSFFNSAQRLLTDGGCIAVALAEGPTYSLWDCNEQKEGNRFNELVKGLAKQTGLLVRRSGSFVGSAFPGYSHCKTIGDDGKDHSAKWIGEERNARYYLFEKPPLRKYRTSEVD